ncbi:MAG: hypothetical protein JNL01_08750 [Bdellovibrionales bacterium]|nr:hypothetical protein [Bdellovibrionales bacterium]
MAIPNKATQAKRNRERSNQQRQAEKRDERARRKEEKKQKKADLAPGEDPDLIGIRPGPQPRID